MSKTVTLRQASQEFARLVREAEAGAEFVITLRGQPVARLVPAAAGPVLSPARAAARSRVRRRMESGWPLSAEPLDRASLHER